MGNVAVVHPGNSAHEAHDMHHKGCANNWGDVHQMGLPLLPPTICNMKSLQGIRLRAPQAISVNSQIISGFESRGSLRLGANHSRFAVVLGCGTERRWGRSSPRLHTQLCSIYLRPSAAHTFNSWPTQEGIELCLPYVESGHHKMPQSFHSPLALMMGIDDSSMRLTQDHQSCRAMSPSPMKACKG
eukprot:4935064-Amphidinium_carterae.1